MLLALQPGQLRTLWPTVKHPPWPRGAHVTQRPHSEDSLKPQGLSTELYDQFCDQATWLQRALQARALGDMLWFAKFSCSHDNVLRYA